MRVRGYGSVCDRDRGDKRKLLNARIVAGGGHEGEVAESCRQCAQRVRSDRARAGCARSRRLVQSGIVPSLSSGRLRGPSRVTMSPRFQREIAASHRRARRLRVLIPVLTSSFWLLP